MPESRPHLYHLYARLTFQLVCMSCRLLWAEGGDAAQSPFHGQVVTLDMLPAADFMHEPRLLYEQWSTDAGASNGSALGSGRRLQQTGGEL